MRPIKKHHFFKKVAAFSIAFTIATTGAASASVVRYASEQMIGECSSGWALTSVSNSNFLCTKSTYVYDTTGVGVDIYIVDTGVDKSVKDFGNRVLSEFDATSDAGTPLENIPCEDHGTGVADNAAGAEYGIAKDANIISVKVFKCGARGSTIPDIVRGLQWVREHLNSNRRSVVNMSLLFATANSAAVSDEIDKLQALGVPTVVSAGNTFGEDACTGLPNTSPNVILVGGYTEEYTTDGTYVKSTYPASQGSCVSIFAPFNSKFFANQSMVELSSGSSYSAPKVAGAIARYFEYNPLATPAEAKAWLIANAKDGSKYLTPTVPGTTTRVLYIPNMISNKVAPHDSKVLSLTKVKHGLYRLVWTQKFDPAVVWPSINGKRRYLYFHCSSCAPGSPQDVKTLRPHVYEMTFEAKSKSKVHFRFMTNGIMGDEIFLNQSKDFILK